MRPASVSIRQFNFPDDYEVVIRLWNQFGAGIHLGASDAPSEIMKKITRDPDLFLLAEADHRLVGAVLGGYDGRRGMMYHLAVDASYRRMGIATRLADELEDRLRAKGCLKVYLLVVPENQEAQRFYESRGWGFMPLFLYGKEL